MRNFQNLVGALAALPAANCVAFGGPAATETASTGSLDGWTPKPTQGPSVGELKKRQSSFDYETCGWVDGDMSSAITCPIGTCMLYTASSIGMAGCCDSDTQNCGWAKDCVDYDAFWSSTVCGDDCYSDSFTRKCTDSDLPYCVTWTYADDDVTDYGCAYTSDSFFQTIYMEATDTYYSSSTSMSLETLSGNDVTGWDGSSGATATDDSDSTATDGATDTATADSTGTDALTGGSLTTTDDSLQATGLAAGGGSGSSSSKKKKKKTNIGVIVGAAIGGVVILCLAVGLAIFCCLKAKKKKSNSVAQPGVAPAPFNQSQAQNQPAYAQNQPMQQQQQQQAFVPHQAPLQPGPGGYFQPSQDQKFNPQTQVHEYPASPMSQPGTPAPPYVQPYYAPPNTMSPPPVPQTPQQYQAAPPAPGTFEVDGISSAQAPPSRGQGQGVQGGYAHEIGQGK